MASVEAMTTTNDSGRRSPPTERVVQVLDHLVAHRNQRFGLSELARNLGISKPTCLGIVTALVEGGYLTRDSVTKSYGLGPALIVAGRAAHEGFAIGAVASRHLAPVGRAFGTTCSASTVVGDRIVVLDITAPDGVRAAARVGEVYPFAPPVGLMYVLWGSDADLDAWLEREPTLPVRIDRERLTDVVAQCRADGYLVETLTPLGRRLHSAMAGVRADDLPPQLRELLGDMASSVGERVHLHRDEGEDGAGSHAVSVIAAPTYDADGRQSLVVTLHVGESIDRAQIEQRGIALVAAANAITAEIGGRPPRDR